MAEEIKTAQAMAVFATVCQALDNRGWKYKKNEEKLTVECGARGEDLPMDLNIVVDAKRNVIMLLSHMPFVVQEDKRVEVAIAVSAINNMLVDGCFDFDIQGGHMFFRMTNSFIDSTVSEDMCMYLVLVSAKTIDDFNDKLLMLVKGMISLEQFLGAIKK